MKQYSERGGSVNSQKEKIQNNIISLGNPYSKYYDSPTLLVNLNKGINIKNDKGNIIGIKKRKYNKYTSTFNKEVEKKEEGREVYQYQNLRNGNKREDLKNEDDKIIKIFQRGIEDMKYLNKSERNLNYFHQDINPHYYKSNRNLARNYSEKEILQKNNVDFINDNKINIRYNSDEKDKNSKNSDNEKKEYKQKKMNYRANSNPEELNNESVYHGNAYHRRRKYWESKSNSKDKESSKESNESGYKYLNENIKICNLKESLRSKIINAKFVIQKLPLCFISKKKIIYKTLPINNVFFCSKKIMIVKILPIVDLFFTSKKIINIKRVVVNNISFVSKIKQKCKITPKLNVSFMTKNYKKIKILPKINLCFISKKIKKNKINFKLLPKNQFEKTFFSKHFEKPINQKFSYSGISIFPSNKMIQVQNSMIEISNQIPKKKLLSLEQEIIKRPIISLLYCSKYVKQKKTELIPIQKRINKELFITKLYIKRNIKNDIEKEKIFKKPISINNIITKCIYSPIKKPINLNCQIIKNHKKSPIKKPKIKNNYISKFYFIKAYKLPISQKCYITKIKSKSKNIINIIKHPIPSCCYITKKKTININKPEYIFQIKETQKKYLNKSQQNSFSSEPIKLSKKDMTKENLSKSNSHSNYKKKRTRRGGKAARRRHSHQSKNSSDYSSKNSFKSEISIEMNNNFEISPYLENKANNNKINKKLKLPIPPKRKNEYTLQMEREVEFQIDDNKYIKNFLSQSNQYTDNEEPFRILYKNDLTERDNLDEITYLFKNQNKSFKTKNMKKNFRSSSSIIDNFYFFHTPTKEDKMRVKVDNYNFDGRKLFEQDLIIDSQKEIKRRKNEIIPINDYQFENIKIKKSDEKKTIESDSNSEKIISTTEKIDVIIKNKIFRLKKTNSMSEMKLNNMDLIKNLDYDNNLKKPDCYITKSVENKQEENEENNTTLTDSHGIKFSPLREEEEKKLINNSIVKKFKKNINPNIPKPQSMSLQFILSVKNYFNSYETYKLPKSLLDHFNALKSPVYCDILSKSKTDRKNIFHSRNKSLNSNSSSFQSINVNLNLNYSFNKEESISKWARKDISKETEKAEQFIKDLNSKLEEDTIKHDITSILNIVTVDNFDEIYNKLLFLLKNSFENQDKFIELILEKSFVENSFVVLYAKLCRILCEIIGGNKQEECYLRRKLIYRVKNCFDEFNEQNNNTNIELNPDEFCLFKKKFLGLINLIVELIEVKIVSQKIGFYFLNSLYDKYIQSNNKNKYSFKFIYLEAIISFLSKFGKIISNRNKNDNKNKLKNFMNKKLTLIKEEELIPGHLKYRIINLFEKQNNNWKDSLYEKSLIPKGKGNEEEIKINLSDIDREDIIKEDLKKWFDYLNKYNIISPDKINKKTFNKFNWTAIDKLFIDEKIELTEIIRCFIEVCIDLINKKEDIFKANQYIYSIIDYYSQFLNNSQIFAFNNKMISFFLEVNNLVMDNNLIFEILGFLMYILINMKLFFIKDLSKFIDKDNESIINISKVVKFAIDSSGKEKKKLLNDFKQNKLYSTFKEIFDEIIAQKIKID